ncbi:MAG TPA: DUF6232 family protein [Pilimelia sp.]|nr:DUF6232 family protein [Pilimelia sp.]
MDRRRDREPRVELTADGFAVDGRVIPLAELSRVWHRHGGRSWRRLAGRGALVAMLVAPLGLAALAVVAAFALELTAMTTATVVMAAVVLGVAAFPLADLLLERMDRSYARGAREWEIWGRWRDEDVLLLRTRDQLEFGQVYRAITRALDR